MIRIFDNPIANVRRNFKEAGKEDRFFDAFNRKANDAKLIGKLIEGLFDFLKTTARNEDNLELLSKRCIDISLLAFPGLQVLDKEEIAKGFLENVSDKQKWALKPKKIEKIAQKISDSTNGVRPKISINKK